MPTTLEVRTGSKTELIDVTSRVQEVVTNSDVTEGLCQVFVPHTTAGAPSTKTPIPASRSTF